MILTKRDAPETSLPRQHFAVSATGWACLGLLLFWLLHRIWTALLIPWWFNTDEVAIYSEVIRQLRLDPSQMFFDIPGTPYMTLTSVLTTLWWAAARLVGLTGTAGPSDFAFENVQSVYTLMRALTLGMYVAAVALTFDLFRRSAGVLTALLTAVLVASLPVHVHYSHFVRTESMGLVLCLAGIWIVLYSRWRATPEVYCYAGILSGAAMGARFHFALVGFPIILVIFMLRDRQGLPPDPQASGYRSLYVFSGALAAFFIAGGMVTLLLKAGLIGSNWLTDTMMLTSPAGPAQYSAAKQAVAKLWLLFGLGGIPVLLSARLPRARRWSWPVINPFTLMLGIGFAAGLLLSHPAFLWRGEQQLRSIQFYSEWTDPNLASLGPLRSWLNVTRYYFNAALPERWLQVAFPIGIGVILWRRQPVHLAFLGGAAICFFAHPVTMKLWPHHIIPWLPFLCFVAAAPAELLSDWLARRYRHPAFGAALVLLLMVATTAAIAPRLRRADEYLKTSRARTDQIVEMNQWLSKNVPADSYLLMSYYALNEDGFLKWIETSGIQVPEFVKKRRNIRIWWLEKSAVDGQSGYLCISKADISFFRADFERKTPGSTYDPFEDSRFEPMATFGGGFYELHVFKFDFRRREVAR